MVSQGGAGTLGWGTSSLSEEWFQWPPRHQRGMSGFSIVGQAKDQGTLPGGSVRGFGC